MRPDLFRRRAHITIAAASILTIAACKGDSVTAPGGESEVISRVTLTLNPSGTSSFAPSAYIEDSDGSGPTAPSAQVGDLTLAKAREYVGSIRFENRLVTPVENITSEVLAEANEHRVFYTVVGDGVTVTTTDTDSNGRPLGVAFTLGVGANATSGSRTLRVVLCHYADVAKPAVATSCTVDTDIDVNFTLSIP